MLSFFNDGPEEILLFRIDINPSMQFDGFQSSQHPAGDNPERIDNFWNATRMEDGDDNIWNRKPERVIVPGREIVYSHLPVIARLTVFAASRQDIAVWDDFYEPDHLLPCFMLEKIVRSQPSEECFYFRLTVLHDLDLTSHYERPESHESVNGRIHRVEICIYRRTHNFSYVNTGSATKKCRLREPEIFFGKAWLSLKNRLDSHRP